MNHGWNANSCFLKHRLMVRCMCDNMHTSRAEKPQDTTKIAARGMAEGAKMEKLNYKVIEDNAGGLHLYVFKSENVIYAHYGFESNPDDLIKCLELLDGGDDPREWDGCEEGDLNAQYEETTSYEFGWNLVAESGESGFDLINIEKMGANAQQAFQIYEFDSGDKASLLKAEIIHNFDSDSEIKVVKGSGGRYECFIHGNNGEISEVPHIDDTEQMEIWLVNTGLTLDDFLKKIQGLELWD